MNKLLVLLLPAVLAAQDFHLNFDNLKAKASETVEVNLDGNLLLLARKFLSDKDPDERKAKEILDGIKGIYVRVLKFENAGEYTEAAIDQIRNQIKGPSWQKIVDVRGKAGLRDNVGIYMKSDGAKIQGLVVLAAEPKELTVVNLVGTINPEYIKDLSGQFGIPNLKDDKKSAGKKKDD